MCFDETYDDIANASAAISAFLPSVTNILLELSSASPSATAPFDILVVERFEAAVQAMNKRLVSESKFSLLDRSRSILNVALMLLHRRGHAWGVDRRFICLSVPLEGHTAEFVARLARVVMADALLLFESSWTSDDDDGSIVEIQSSEESDDELIDLS